MTNTPKDPLAYFNAAADTVKPVATMTLLIGTDAIDKAIASIKTRGAKLDQDIWIAAVSALQHHDLHGDTTLVNRLVAAMPKGSRVNALRDFITCVGKVKFNDKTKQFDHDKEGTFDLAAAVAVSWTEYKPEPAYVPFDALKAIKALVAKLDSADTDKGDKVTAEQDKAIRTLAAQLGA